MKRIVLPLLLLVGLCAAFTTKTRQATSTPLANDTTPKYEMKQYWMVFLLKGTNRGQDSATAAVLQAGHIANIERLHREGKIVMAGPMGYNRDLRGIFIMDAKDSSEAASFVNTDPAVIAGRLRFEIHPWWVGKGTYIFK
jgi:uncharacterized protein YciI